MRLSKISAGTVRAILAIDRKHLLAFAGSLAYYYLLSLLPLLILLASVQAYIPIPNLFNQILIWMSYFIPPDSMMLVKKVLADIMGTRSSGFLSIGVLGTIWAASGASAAMIEALNVAYDVKEGRPFWHTRSLAIGITFMLGALLSTVLTAMTLGPELGGRLAHRLGADPIFAASWFYFRWVLAVSFSVLAVEIVYYLAPNVEQRKFWRTVPGAVIAVLLWIGASYGLGFYLQRFGQLSKSYGTLGAVAALLLWFYVSSAAILVGAAVNVELLKTAREQLPVKEVAATSGKAGTPSLGGEVGTEGTKAELPT